MGKYPKKSLHKLKKKLRKIEDKLKLTSKSGSDAESQHSRRSLRLCTPTHSPVRRSKTRSRSRLRLSSCSSHEQMTPERKLKENIEPIDLTEEPAATTDDVDPDILQLLGNCPEDKVHGPELLQSIIARWQPILKNGMVKEEKLELIKKYPPPVNFKILNAPKLNPEVQAASSETTLKRDKAIETKQNQMSIAITALGSALNNLCKSGSSNNDSIGLISDAARLLCDCHHSESLTRRGFTVSGLEKSTRDGIKDTIVDEWLFVADFSDKLKASKAIKKSGQDLRATSTHTKNKPLNRNNNLNFKGPTNNSFKQKTQKTPMKHPAKQYNNQTKTTNTQQSNSRYRQQNQYRRQ